MQSVKFLWAIINMVFAFGFGLTVLLANKPGQLNFKLLGWSMLVLGVVNTMAWAVNALREEPCKKR